MSGLPSTVPAIPSNNQSAIHAFSSRQSAVPAPQPGKYPVVFNTGPGDPRKITYFQPEVVTIKSVVKNFPLQYADSPRFREFKVHSGLDDFNFAMLLQVITLLAIAQQFVHAHVNLGLPLGDHSPVASTDFAIPQAVSAYVRQFGELTVPTIGTRFLLANYDTTVRSLVLRANRILLHCETQDDIDQELDLLWCPIVNKDQRTKFILAVLLNRWFLLNFGVRFECEVLAAQLFEGSLPPVFEGFRELLGSDKHPEPEYNEDGNVILSAEQEALPEAQRDPPPHSHRRRFEFLFEEYENENDFAAAFAQPGPQAVLAELGLAWPSPTAPDLGYTFMSKREFQHTLDPWIEVLPSVQKFLTTVAAVHHRSTACGSLSQFSAVDEHAGTTTTSSLIAVLAPEYSLLTCFQPKAMLCPRFEYHAKVPTPILASDRAQEFVTKDWS